MIRYREQPGPSPVLRKHTACPSVRAIAARQHGAAVLVAMLVVAIAALAASSFMFRSRVEWRRLENLTRADQAHWVLRAAQQWGASVLLEDTLHSSVDHLGEVWATQLPPVEAEGYRVSGGMEDAQARFNLNNLVVNGQADAGQLAIFVRLLRILHLPDNLAYLVADWMDADDAPLNPDSAESAYYEDLATPYRAANRPLLSVNELLRVKGFDRNVLSVLRPYVAVLPARTPINVNTASPEVLAALVEGLTSQQAYAMVARRERTYYRNSQDFQLALPEGLTAPGEMVSVSSQYFLVQVRVRNERLAIGNQALYHREGPVLPKLVWRAEL
ncbi:MAG TPA: type II secretion system minor pseudopilin GspK [Thiobacillaceae bacterium]|nr:type II secretion system minor pseudopilin GspK [Thiobacillaceae bacterium]